MSWVRANGQKHQGRVRMVISGSIGLEPILRRAGLSATLNAFEAFDLRPWPAETAVGCIKALARGKPIGLEEGVAEAMVARLGCCIPHHVQLFFTQAYTAARLQGKTALEIASVDEIYETRMLSVRGHAEAAVIGELTLEARKIIAQEEVDQGRTTAEVVAAQREVLWVLEHDGYLRNQGGVYRFVSRLLRDWWRARNEAHYVGTAARRRGNV